MTLDVVTIFGNQIWLFLCDSSRITIELNLFHGIQDGYACIPYGIQWNPCGIHVELMWNPCGIHMEFTWNGSFHDHSMTIPSSFHMESMMSWNKKLAGVSANIHSMDSIQKNPGKVKTSILTKRFLMQVEFLALNALIDSKKGLFSMVPMAW